MSVAPVAQRAAAAGNAWKAFRLPIHIRQPLAVRQRTTRVAIDAGTLALATLLVRGSDSAMNAAIAAFAVAAFVLLVGRDRRTRRLRLDPFEELRAAFAATTLAAMAVTSTSAVLGEASAASGMLVPWLVGTILVGAVRSATVYVETRARRAGAATRPTLIVGAGMVGRLTARRLAADPTLGLKPVGFLDNEPRDSADVDDPPVLGASWDFDRVVEEHAIGHVVFTFSTAPHEVLLRIAQRCEERRIAMSVVPRLFERMTERLEVEHVGGIAIVTPMTVDCRRWQFGVKHALDRVLAALLLVAVLPVFAAAAAATWLSLGRPIFFRQTRVARDGHPFSMLKFRSMRDGPVHHAAVELGADSAPGGVEGDDRRTRVGTLLRKTSIDELPQLLNVLKGEMSLVGPRPERPEFVATFDRSVYRYSHRHRVKGGITGWAQINGLRGKTSISDRAEWDNHYIENWSLWLDLKILARTAAAVVGCRNVE